METVEKQIQDYLECTFYGLKSVRIYPDWKTIVGSITNLPEMVSIRNKAHVLDKIIKAYESGEDGVVKNFNAIQALREYLS